MVLPLSEASQYLYKQVGDVNECQRDQQVIKRVPHRRAPKNQYRHNISNDSKNREYQLKVEKCYNIMGVASLHIIPAQGLRYLYLYISVLTLSTPSTQNFIRTI